MWYFKIIFSVLLGILSYFGYSATTFCFEGECGPGDDPMPFLCPTEKELLAFAATKYDTKKNVWVPHKKEGYVKAEIQDTSGEKVTVKTAKGEVGLFSITPFPCPFLA